MSLVLFYDYLITFLSMVYSLSFSPPFLSSPFHHSSFPFFTSPHPSFPLPSLPRPSSFLPLSISPLLSRPPYFPFLSLSVLTIFPFLPFCPPYSSGTLRGDPNPVVMKEFVKILFSIYRTVVLSAYFFYFLLFYQRNATYYFFCSYLFAIFHNLVILTVS